MNLNIYLNYPKDIRESHSCLFLLKSVPSPAPTMVHQVLWKLLPSFLSQLQPCCRALSSFDRALWKQPLRLVFLASPHFFPQGRQKKHRVLTTGPLRNPPESPSKNINPTVSLFRLSLQYLPFTWRRKSKLLSWTWAGIGTHFPSHFMHPIISKLHVGSQQAHSSHHSLWVPFPFSSPS